MKKFAHTPARLAVTGALALGLSGGVAATTAPQAATAAPAPASISVQSAVSARTAARAVNVASTRKGAPYRWGGTGPSSFDCSGLVQWTYGKVGKKVPRTANQQWSASKRISKGSARPGDLVFYGGSYKYHVGIYAGNGKMWHAPGRGKDVRLVKVYGSPTYGRI